MSALPTRFLSCSGIFGALGLRHPYPYARSHPTYFVAVLLADFTRLLSVYWRSVDEVEVGTGVSDAASGVASLSSAVAVGVACAAAVAATACFASSHMALNGLL